MKLAHTAWRMVIDWPENRVPVLAIESPVRFRRAVQGLMRQADGGSGEFVLSEEAQIRELGRICEVFSDPLLLEINDRSVQSALTKWVKTTAVSERCYLATQEICQKILAWAAEIAQESEEPLVFSDELDWTQIIKVCGLRFDGEDGDLPEKLLRRMRIAQSFLHKDCFIFVNLKRYLSQEELNVLYREAFYRKIRIMLVENLCPPIDRAYETAWIIDQDDCEIYPDDV